MKAERCIGSRRKVANTRTARWRRLAFIARIICGSAAATPLSAWASTAGADPSVPFASTLGEANHFWLHIAPYILLGAVVLGIVTSRLFSTQERARERAREMVEGERLRLIEDRARAAERQAHQFIMSDINGILVADADGVILLTNPALESLFKYGPGELRGQRIEVLVPDAARSAHERLRARYVSSPKQRMMMAGRPLEGRAKDGSMIPIEVSLSSKHGPDGLSVMATIIDISERVRAEEKLRQMANVFESTGEGIVITNAKFRIVNTNPAFTSITGYEADEVLGRNIAILRSGRHDNAFYMDMARAIKTNAHWCGEHWSRRKDGGVFPEWLTVSGVLNETGTVTHYVYVFADISHIIESKKVLERQAHFDALTELPNRVLLYDRIKHALVRAERHSNMLALAFLDLDNFKYINDGLGHEVGDKLLQQVAGILTSAVRKEDTVARLGSDEFVLLLENIRSIEDATVVADKLKSGLDIPFTMNGQEIRVTASIGLCFYPRDGADLSTLLRNADSAMYRAKAAGRNCYQFYTEELTLHSSERVFLENSLRRALQRHELHLVYQPQVEISTGHLVAVEALARWNHPQRGNIPPERFVPLAEESGLIEALERWILTEACTQARKWKERGIAFGRMAVNISGRTLQNGVVLDTVKAVLDETGCPSDCMELELRESLVMSHDASVFEQMKALREIGMVVSIDDFGTGHSSLSRLSQLPIDKLKIDRSFMRDLYSDDNCGVIVSAVIAMGRKLNLVVITEGVETLDQMRFLTSEDCPQAQGYLYARPMSAGDFERYLQSQGRLSEVGGKIVRLFPTG